jgi:hypothetical protein
MFDGNQDDVRSDFIYRYLNHQKPTITIKEISAGGEGASIIQTLEYVDGSTIPDQDLVYFLENDYFHQPGWLSKVLHLFDSDIDRDYVTLYDHPDKYYGEPFLDLQSKISHTGTQFQAFNWVDHHWRTTPSACWSFILEARVFRTDRDVLSAGIPDYFMFQMLREERRRIVLSPIPGLSTHCLLGFNAPSVNWRGLVV